MEPLSLHFNAVSPELLDLLVKLMDSPALQDFHLVGGTSLALRLGHRRSVDLDLFTTESFDAGKTSEALVKTLPVERYAIEKDTISAVIAKIKVELITHAYPLLEPVENIAGIRIASLRDLAAMKLNAISGRGLRKDFYDLAALLDIFPLEAMLGFFQAKYAHKDLWHLIRSLDYFLDADADTSPLQILSQVTWQQVKDKVQTCLRDCIPYNTGI